MTEHNWHAEKGRWVCSCGNPATIDPRQGPGHPEWVYREEEEEKP